LAEVLGLDPSRFRGVETTVEAEREFHSFESQISDAERFRLCEPLKLKCRLCKEESAFGGMMDNSNGMINPSGIHCPNEACEAHIPLVSVQIQVEHQVRAAINKFYESWVVCDDQSCSNRTRMIGVYGRRCLKPDCRGRMHNEVSAFLSVKWA
jgi:DNA polymerase alpha subunit A